MKFRACFSDVGVAWLEKRFLPAFEKAAPGRPLELSILLTPDSVFLVHDAKALGGPEIHADFAVAELFDPESYKLQSAHSNKIAFKVEAGMLRRVLAGLGASDAERIEVKLTKRVPPPTGAAPPATPPAPAVAAAPFLEFTAAGEGLNICQGVPLIGEPLRRSVVDELERLVGGGATRVPYWLEIPPRLAQHLCAELGSLKAVRPTLDLATTPDGDLHLYASTHALTLGTEHRGLKARHGVAPQTCDVALTRAAIDQVAPRQRPAAAFAATTPGGRLAAARAADAAAEVHLAARDLLLALSFHVTRCDCVLLGVAAGRGFVEVAMRYDEAGGAPDAVALGIKLPVKDPEQLAMQF